MGLQCRATRTTAGLPHSDAPSSDSEEEAKVDAVAAAAVAKAAKAVKAVKDANEKAEAKAFWKRARKRIGHF